MRSIRRADMRSGFSLVELLVSLAIFSIIALVVSSFLIDSLRVNHSVEAKTDVGVLGSQALDDLRWKLEQSRRILDAESGFIPSLDLSGAPAPIGEVRLPRIEPTGSLSPNAAATDGAFSGESVGNALLFVEALSPHQDPKSGTLVDLYRFVLYYVAKLEGHPFSGMPHSLDLVRWESVPYADFQQIESLRKEERSPVIRGLAARGVAFAWDAGSPANAAFSRLAGGALVEPPEPSHRVRATRVESAIPGLGRGQRISGVLGYSVAPNDGIVPIRNVVPKFAVPAPGFPNGFEVLVAGSGHGRKVLLRLVLAAEAQGRFYSREHLAVAAVRD